MPRIILLAAILTAAVFPAQAANNGHVEYSALLNSPGLQGLHSLSAYSPRSRYARLHYYSGMELAWYQPDSSAGFVFNPRVLLGLTAGRNLAPFVEVSTSLLNLLEITSGEVRDCNQSPCDPDIGIRAGLRMQLHSQFSVVLFYQAIHFGNFNSNISGDHRMLGAGIGIHF